MAMDDKRDERRDAAKYAERRNTKHAHAERYALRATAHGPTAVAQGDGQTNA